MDASRKATEQSGLEAQRRLLQSLGFGFVEEPAPVSETRPAEPAPPPAPRSRPPAPRKSAAPAPAAPISAQPAVPAGERAAALEALAARVATCTACPLHHTRSHPVAGEGSSSPRVVFIGEAPTADDDTTGRPFQGEIGRMLGDIVKAMKLAPDDVFMAMAAKCHPVGGRTPRIEEVTACSGYLHRQMELLRPEAIVCFGIAGVQALLPDATGGGIQQIRGRWLDYRSIPLIPTFALPYIHRNTARKRVVWEDLQSVMKRIGTR